MAELAIGQLIKIILGIFVVVAVLAGLFFFFRDNVFEFFKIASNEPNKLFLGLYG